MFVKNLLCCSALALAALVLPAASTAKADGTVIQIKNYTSKAMTFFVEVKTDEGQVRHFLQGAYLKAGQSTTFTLEDEYAVGKRSGKYLIRVRGFLGRLDSLKWNSVENESPDYWWGGNQDSFTGLKCLKYDDMLSAELIM